MRERRGCARVDVISDCADLVVVEVPDLATTGLLVDLSESGMAVQFAVPLPGNSISRLSFALGKTRVSCNCEVVWTADTMIGVRFVRLSPDSRNQIRAWRDSASETFAGLPAESVSTNKVAAEEDADPGVASSLAVPGADDRSAPDNTNFAFARPDAIGHQLEAAPTPGQEAPSPAAGAQPDWVSRMLARQRLSVRRGYQDEGNDGPLPEHDAWRPLSAGAAHPLRARQQVPSSRPTGARPLPTGEHVPKPAAVLDREVEKLATELRDRTEGQPGTVHTVDPPSNSSRASRSTAIWSGFAVLAVLAAVAGFLSWKPDSPSSHQPAVTALPAGQRPSSTASVVEVFEGEPVLPINITPSPSQPFVRGQAVHQNRPGFPPDLLASATEGEVQALLTITERGAVANIRIRSGNPPFVRAAEASMAHWTYSPFLVGSTPLSVQLPVIVRFRILPAPAAPVPSNGPTSH